MNLSEAIRLGAMAHPQCCDGFLWRDGKTCALGAAYLAAGILHGDKANLGEVAATFPVMLNPLQKCPACNRRHVVHNVGDVVSHLNDFHLWTREQIADWVETVEPRAVPAAVDARDPTAAEVV